jgi:hypothetical protein
VALASGRNLIWELPGAVVYPFRGKEVFLILAGGVFFLLLGFVPLIGLLTTGYLFNYAKGIVASTAIGEENPPDWPDFSNWFEDMVMPYLELLALSAVTFGPALLVYTFAPEQKVALWTTIVLGALLTPMATLALAMFDTVTALNPIPLVASILRIPGAYLLASVPFMLFVGAFLYSDQLFLAVIPSRFGAYLAGGALNLYFVAVAMRIIGLLYRTHSGALGWSR